MWYEVITDHGFDDDCENLGLSADEREVFLEAVEWLLSREPELGQRTMPDPISLSYYWYRHDSGRDIVVQYRIEGDSVILERAVWDTSDDF